MEGENTSILQAKIADSLATQPPALTRRSVQIPEVPGKALAVTRSIDPWDIAQLESVFREDEDWGHSLDHLIII
jgi:hypothetical protein